jgi:hypothetical protein
MPGHGSPTYTSAEAAGRDLSDGGEIGEPSVILSSYLRHLYMHVCPSLPLRGNLPPGYLSS